MNRTKVSRIIVRYISAILIVLVTMFAIPMPHRSYAAQFSDSVDASSAILIEASSGKVLYEQNADQPLPPASVTKIMTLLICMEAVDSGKIHMTDTVTVSDNAASMGGSQVYLEAGERMSVEDMVKSVVISSANDAAVALAEHIAGSEGAFVAAMNKRAEELGMNNTHFENTNGLDDSTDKHLISARDISIMSAELLKHEKILDYTTIWQDTIRNGSFTLSNTNRLIRFYEGANGLKTGSTAKAKYCISASAKRDGMQLICVIMGAPTRDIRNAEAKKLLDYGFACWAKFSSPSEMMGTLSVKGGNGERVSLYSGEFGCVIDKGKIASVKKIVEIPEDLSAPVNSGDVIGKITYTVDGEKIGEVDIVASNTVGRISFGDVLMMILKKFVSII